jgi:CheY-like chemotaxis protein
MPNKILIVDDEPFNLDLLEQELEDPIPSSAPATAEALDKFPSSSRIIFSLHDAR